MVEECPLTFDKGRNGSCTMQVHFPTAAEGLPPSYRVPLRSQGRSGYNSQNHDGLKAVSEGL
jgi:hypothetical protein